MKKLVSLLLACVVALGLFGCGGAAGTDSRQIAADHNTLIVYFSYTGNTRALAEKIHDRIGGDIVELQLKEPYSTDYKHVESQGKDEVERGVKPELATEIKNFDQYDIVLVGSPVWSGTMPSVLADFLRNEGFAGKRLLPFTTHMGSGLGNIVQAMSALCPRAQIGPGLALRSPAGEEIRPEVAFWLRQTGVRP